MKALGTLLIILVAFVGGVFIGVYDTVASVAAPHKATGIANAVMQIVGPILRGSATPPLPSYASPASAYPEPGRPPKAPDPETLIQIKVGKPYVDRHDRPHAPVTIINNSTVGFSTVTWDCYCDDENGRFSGGGGNVKNVAAGETVESEGTCIEKLRGKKLAMQCRIGVGLEE